MNPHHLPGFQLPAVSENCQFGLPTHSEMAQTYTAWHCDRWSSPAENPRKILNRFVHKLIVKLNSLAFGADSCTSMISDIIIHHIYIYRKYYRWICRVKRKATAQCSTLISGNPGMPKQLHLQRTRWWIMKANQDELVDVDASSFWGLIPEPPSLNNMNLIISACNPNATCFDWYGCGLKKGKATPRRVENGSLQYLFPFIYRVIFHWTMIMGERVSKHRWSVIPSQQRSIFSDLPCSVCATCGTPLKPSTKIRPLEDWQRFKILESQPFCCSKTCHVIIRSQ